MGWPYRPNLRDIKMLLRLRQLILFLLTLIPICTLAARKLDGLEDVNLQASQEQETFKKKYGALIEKYKEEERLAFEKAQNAIEEIGKSLQEFLQHEREKECAEQERINALSNEDFAVFMNLKLVEFEQFFDETPVIQILEAIYEVGNMKNISHENARLFFSIQQDILQEYSQLLSENHDKLSVLGQFFAIRSLDEQKAEDSFKFLEQKYTLIFEKVDALMEAVQSAQQYLVDKKSTNSLTSLDGVTGALLLLRGLFA